MVKLYQFLKKYGVAISFGTGTVLVILTYAIIMGGFPAGNPTNKELYSTGVFDFGLFSTYFLTFVCILASLIFPIIYMAKNFKESIKAIIGLALIVVLFLVSYLIGNSTIPPDVIKGIETGKLPAMTEGQMKLVDGSIILSYIMLFLSIGAIIFANIRSFGK